MTSQKVIVFGPTGAVGSAAARTAAEHGAEVVLAMRDTSKAIPGLSAEKEKQGRFQRVTADLSEPETIKEAVTSTKAKHAFIYVRPGLGDGMRSTVEALKAGGIELVVFLSSFTVLGDKRAIKPTDFISHMHSQVEISLEEVFGPEGYVALRPGSFASNSLEYKDGLNKGEIKVFAADEPLDCIVPEDIGRVGGKVLAEGPPRDGNRAIYLLGPELISTLDTAKIIVKVMGSDAKIVIGEDEQDWLNTLIEGRHLPPPLAKYILEQYKKPRPTGGLQIFGIPVKEEDFHNVEKYSGVKATTFQEWVEQNKDVFKA